MKKVSKKVGLILGSAALAVGIVALPALAATTEGNSGNVWFGQMQSYMNRIFTPAQQQQIMNSSAMQELHNSNAMQQAMQSWDITKMENLMNSDPNLKAQIGQGNLNTMDQIMNNFGSQNQSELNQSEANRQGENSLMQNSGMRESVQQTNQTLMPGQQQAVSTPYAEQMKADYTYTHAAGSNSGYGMMSSGSSMMR